MKKFTKLFLACAAVTAVTAAVATTAMAAVDVTGGELTGTYAEGQLTLTGLPAKAETVLVLKADADTTAVKDSDILYVNQDEFATIKLMGAPSEEDATGAIVLVGYTDDKDQFAILKGKIGGSDVMIGDATLNGKVNVDDATAIIKHAAKIKLLEGDALEAADANGNGKVNVDDATCVIKYSAKMTTGIGNIGK